MKFYGKSILLRTALATVAFLQFGQADASAAGKGVVITFTNATATEVVIRRTNSKPAPFLSKKETTVPGGGEAELKSTQGESFGIYAGRKRIAEYTATAEEQQIFTIAPAAATGSKLDPDQARQLVEYHNLKRNEAGVGPLVWSKKLAVYAQQRADSIAQTKRFAHLPQGRNPYGENLAQGGRAGEVPGFTVLEAAESWYAEKGKMPKGARTMTTALFNRGVGHYTQMIWNGSTEIGAGIAHYRENGFAMTVVVCCYNPPGNLIGGSIY